MALIDKPLDSIVEQDLLNLIENRIREDKQIEYKSVLPGNSEKEKKEFLADVSSFANASGGDLIFGMEASGGFASRLSGIDFASLDKEVLRLENLLRDGLDPRIPNVRIQPVSLPSSGGAALVVRVLRSWIPPHRVKYGGTSRFYSRNSAGKYELEVSEMRPLFELSVSMTEKIRNFRLERLSKILAGEINLPLKGAHRLVLHLVPFNAFDPSTRFELSKLTLENGELTPLNTYSSFHKPRHNFEGLLSYATTDHWSCYSYLQVFRNGCIEAVNTSLLKRNEYKEHAPELLIYDGYEKVVHDFVIRMLKFQRKLGVELPIFVMLTFLAVKGYRIAFSGSFHPGENHPIDQNDLILPEELIESYEADIEAVMNRIYGIVWNAAGFSRPPKRR